MKVKRYKISQQGVLDSKATDPTKKCKNAPYPICTAPPHPTNFQTHKTQKIAIIAHLPKTTPLFFPPKKSNFPQNSTIYNSSMDSNTTHLFKSRR